jgi:hypothetical protein
MSPKRATYGWDSEREAVLRREARRGTPARVSRLIDDEGGYCVLVLQDGSEVRIRSVAEDPPG